jgi:predicted phosphodiesterase
VTLAAPLEHTEAPETPDTDAACHDQLEIEEHPSASWVAVMSDAHIGDSDSWMERQAIQDAVTSCLAARPSIGTLVLLGDTLDLNFAPLKTAVDGRWHGPDHPRDPGLRAFLDAVCTNTKVDRIIYVPGNHDYSIRDLEATNRNSLDALKAGEELPHSPMWRDRLDDSFLTGLIPKDRRNEVRLIVPFPHCVAVIGGHRVVLTHGHWFDRIQTAGVALSELDAPSGPEAQAFLRKLVIASAQYQTFARGIAIRRASRAGLHGIYKWAAGIWDHMHARFESKHGLRGKPPNADILRAIGAYLRCVAGETPASALVFGHTHTPGAWEVGTGPQRLPVYNSGSFVPREGEKATLLVLHPDEDELAVDLVSFTEPGEETSNRLRP